MGFDFTQFLNRAADNFQDKEDAAVQATAEYAEVIMADSQEIVPVSPTDPKHPNYTGTSGELRDSGTVGEVVVKGDEISVEEGYNTDYAAAVHERLAVNHQYPGRVNEKAQAKYLEVPMKARAAGYAPYVAQRMQEAGHG